LLLIVGRLPTAGQENATAWAACGRVRVYQALARLLSLGAVRRLTSCLILFVSREISEDNHMQAVLKGLHSPDIADVENYLPHEEDNFAFLLQVMVGPMEGEGEESFDIIVCTPKWLIEKYRPSDILLGLHKLIVFKYDYPAVREFIEKFLLRCSGNTWEEIAKKSELARSVGVRELSS